LPPRYLLRSPSTDYWLPSNYSCFPIKDEIVQNCLSSDCELETFVVRHAIWFGQMSSSLGANVFTVLRDLVLTLIVSCI